MCSHHPDKNLDFLGNPDKRRHVLSCPYATNLSRLISASLADGDPMMDDKIQKMAFSVDEAAMRAGLGRDAIYSAVIIWSGGGFQAFWRLSEIFVVNGDRELMLPAERRMQRIAEAFNADACHNADRIMRLPGTINVLGKTKVRAGRKRALAELIELHEDRIY